jgi:RNA polymerase sigma-70 factor (ECF subfamily)
MEFADGAFVAKARAGEPDAFRVLVDRHSRGLFRLAFRMTGNEADAEDVVQESFLKAYRQLGRFDERSSFGTWLHRIAVNCALDLVRARKRRGELTAADETSDPVSLTPTSEPAPDRLAWGGEFRDRIAEALTELSAMERAAFVLRHYEGQSMEEVGRVLGCHAGAAKHSVFRAVQKLRRALEPLASAAK